MNRHDGAMDDQSASCSSDQNSANAGENDASRFSFSVRRDNGVGSDGLHDFLDHAVVVVGELVKALPVVEVMVQRIASHGTMEAGPVAEVNQAARPVIEY